MLTFTFLIMTASASMTGWNYIYINEYTNTLDFMSAHPQITSMAVEENGGYTQTIKGLYFTNFEIVPGNYFIATNADFYYTTNIPEDNKYISAYDKEVEENTKILTWDFLKQEFIENYNKVERGMPYKIIRTDTFSAYPNPFNNEINVDTDKVIYVYNLLGQKVDQFMNRGGKLLPAGTYFLVAGQEVIQVKKIK